MLASPRMDSEVLQASLVVAGTPTWLCGPLQLALLALAVVGSGCTYVDVHVGFPGAEIESERTGQITKSTESVNTSSVNSSKTLRSESELRTKVREYARLKFAIVDASGQRISYTNPTYYARLDSSLSSEWDRKGSENDSWVFERGNQQIGIVHHETGIEVVLVGMAVAAAAVLLKELWDDHKADLATTTNNIRTHEQAVIFRCPNLDFEMKLLKPSDSSFEAFVENGYSGCEAMQPES